MPPSYRMIRISISLVLLAVFGASGGLLVTTGTVDAVVAGGVGFADAVKTAWAQL